MGIEQFSSSFVLIELGGHRSAGSPGRRLYFGRGGEQGCLRKTPPALGTRLFAILE